MRFVMTGVMTLCYGGIFVTGQSDDQCVPNYAVTKLEIQEILCKYCRPDGTFCRVNAEKAEKDEFSFDTVTSVSCALACKPVKDSANGCVAKDSSTSPLKTNCPEFCLSSGGFCSANAAKVNYIIQFGGPAGGLAEVERVCDAHCQPAPSAGGGASASVISGDRAQSDAGSAPAAIPKLFV